MKLDYKVLEIFQKNPEKEYSSIDLVAYIYPDRYKIITDNSNDPHVSSETKKQDQDELLKLQRKILYHLSELVKKGILYVAKTESKGRKKYALSIESGEKIILDRYKKKIVITKPSTPTLPLGDLEERNIVTRFEKETFFHSLNCVVVSCDQFESLDVLLDYIRDILEDVNDVIGLHHIEPLFLEASQKELEIFFRALRSELSSFKKQICIYCDILNYKPHYFSEIPFLILENSKHISFVLGLSSHEILEYNKEIEYIYKEFLKHNIALHFHNKAIHNGIAFMGSAGPYTITEKRWKAYQEKDKEDSYQLMLGQSSLIVNTDAIKTLEQSAKSFKDKIIRMANALFESNAYQRRNVLRIYKEVPESWRLLEYSKNYIRIKHIPDEADQFLITIQDIKKEIIDFSNNQKTIYLSCGMPTNFRVEFAFQESPTVSISSIEDFYKEKNKEQFKLFEKYHGVFDSSLHIKIDRKGSLEILDALREINIVLSSYHIPFFSYNIKHITGANMNLDMFME